MSNVVDLADFRAKKTHAPKTSTEIILEAMTLYLNSLRENGIDTNDPDLVEHIKFITFYAKGAIDLQISDHTNAIDFLTQVVNMCGDNFVGKFLQQ